MPSNKYLNSLTPQQRKVAAKLKALLQKPSLALKWRLQVGQFVECLVPSGSPERYGQKSMTSLLEFLDQPLHYQAELYAARQAASYFDYSDLPQLIAGPFPFPRWRWRV